MTGGLSEAVESGSVSWQGFAMSDPIELELGHLESPIGRLSFAVCAGALAALEFTSERELRRALRQAHPSASFLTEARAAKAIRERLRAYFGGELDALAPIRVAPFQGTAFQRSVWEALRAVKPGQTASYQELARAVGRPKATRAVGAANGRNPIALVVPCHRIISADGTLGGYAGGLSRKAWLLRHERALLT